MTVDADYIELFKKEVKLLKDLKVAVEAAIEEADGRIKQLNAGKSREEVFRSVPPTQR